MRHKILLLSNSFPYRGEPFLTTEAGFIPEDITVNVWPFFVERSHVERNGVLSNVTSHVYREPSAIGKIVCLLKAIHVFIHEREYIAAFAKKGFCRNIIKGVKFAYISEIRLVSIRKWLRNTRDTLTGSLIYSYWMYETAYVGARLKTEYPQCSFISRCHGYDLYEERHLNGYLPFREFILKNADMICPISDNGEEYLQKRYGSAIKEKIQVSRLGTIRKAEIPEIQKRESAVVLVSCSNLVDVKRVHLILRALNSFHQRVHWYHFGDGELREEIEAQAKTLPQNIECSFMGFQPNEDVQKFYADHYVDAFINVSQSEGIPVSVMEAESYGVPIIATDVGGTSEIVHDRENGVLLDVDFNDEDLIHAIEDVINHSERYRINALHTWELMSDAHILFPMFYRDLTEGQLCRDFV